MHPARRGVRTIACATALAASLALAACGSSSAPASAAGDSPTTITLVYPHYATSVAAVALPEVAKKHGLTIKEIPITTGADAITALSTGKAQAGIFTYTYLVQAKSQNLDLVLLTNNVLGGTRILANKKLNLARGDYAGLQKLISDRAAAGKKLSLIGATPSINWALAVSSLKQHDIDVSKLDVQDVTNYSLHPQMLARGAADLVVTGEPYAAQSLLSGDASLFDYPYDTPLGKANTEWMAEASWVKKNPEVAKRFVAAMQETLSQLQANRDGTVQKIVDFTGLGQDVARESLNSMEFKSCVDKAEVAAAAQYLFKSGIAKTDYSGDVAPFFAEGVSLVC